MTNTKRFFVATLAATALLCQTATAGDTRCGDARYRRAHPQDCDTKSGAAALKIAGGTFAIAGGALALIALSGGGGTDGSVPNAAFAEMPAKPRTGGYPIPQLGVERTDVLGDVDDGTLAAIMSQADYIKNRAQYDEIGVAFSLGRGFTGTGVTVAVLDTGDKYWHGRVVSDIVSAVIAPGASVEMHQIATNSTDFFTWDTIGDTVINASATAAVINNSWNISTSAASITSREQIAAMTSDAFLDAIATATAGGTIFVWAAGNDASGQSGALSALPGVMPELRGHFINVVAWDSATHELADFSNACGVTKDWCITAPGTDIQSGYHTVDGTSFATPMVSAAIAVLQQAFPYLSPAQIVNLIFVTATDLGAPGVDEVYGHGMLDLERASQPVGAATIASADGGVRVLQTAHIDGPVAKQIQRADIKFAYFDAFGRPFQANLSDNISIKNRSIGFARLHEQNRQSVRTGNMEFWISGDDFLAGDGFLQTDGRSVTGGIALTDGITLGNTELFYMTRFGMSHPRPAIESVISEFSNIYTASASVGLRHGDWTTQISAPDTIIGGNMNLRMATGRAPDGTIGYTDHSVSLTGAPAIEYSIGYKFMRMGFVDNPYGHNEIYFVGRSKFMF